MARKTVRFEANERLDIPDARAIQTLTYDYLAFALGGLIGGAGGFLATNTLPIASFSGADPILTFSEGLVFTHIKDGAQLGSSSSRIIHLDPTEQALTVTCTGFAGNPFYVWVRESAPVEADTDTRKKWNEGGAFEETVDIKTRFRIEAVIKAFGVGVNPNNVAGEGTGWAPVAYISDWASGLPKTIWTISAFDDTDLITTNPDVLTERPTLIGLIKPTLDPGESLESHLGLSRLMAAVTQMLFRHLTNEDPATSTNDWRTVPAKGLLELNDAITALEGETPQISDNTDDIAAVNLRYSRAVPLMSGIIKGTGGTYTLASTDLTQKDILKASGTEAFPFTPNAPTKLENGQVALSYVASGGVPLVVHATPVPPAQYPAFPGTLFNRWAVQTFIDSDNDRIIFYLYNPSNGVPADFDFNFTVIGYEPFPSL